MGRDLYHGGEGWGGILYREGYMGRGAWVNMGGDGRVAKWGGIWGRGTYGADNKW